MKNIKEEFWIIALDKNLSNFVLSPQINKFGSVGTIVDAAKWYNNNEYLQNYFLFVKNICKEAKIIKVNAVYDLEES
jgi:hypothetical protein